ncbi:restriction endonuclease subunit S [Niveibacterium sp. 24ML]|uniref:restriction endonuclease subunit S n=1 Tax=Niveibacterium sp. 24ML TaxID=2985512 RepID=UPI00226F890D|nr:restriction endonuclease subunit S [Niveibacterium sp. 24ML]MCX9157799.1 restriction endonuclease subunit S [Niveibacterium sp. 24ML]
MSDVCVEYPHDWASRSLEQISFRITSGGTPTSGSPRYYREYGGLPFAKTEDLTRAGKKFIDGCELAISDAALKETAAKRYPAGTILVSMYGTIGLTKITAVEMAANQALCALIPPFACDSDYLYHHLDHIRAEWLKHSGQTTQANISGAAVRAHVVPLPHPAEQRQIAQVLDTLDTAIHETEAIIAKLKAVKQGLLHDLLTRGIDANGELRPPQAEAPHLYKQSPLGWIPKEWDVSSVGAEFIVDAGITLGQHRVPRIRPRPYLRVANVHRAALKLDDIAYLEASDAEATEKSLRPGDLLVVEGHASTDEIGRCAMADQDVSGFLFQNHLFRLRPRRLNNNFSLLWMNSEFVRAYWRTEAATSSGLNTINRTKLNAVSIAVPIREEQRGIATIAANINARMFGECATREKLRQQKAALMDDLLTGRVRVTPLLEGAAP